MDDWLSGCDDDADGCAMLKEADEVMGQAGMWLATWGSDSEQVDELLCRELQDKSVGEDSFKAIGIRWFANQDCFSFDGVKIPRHLCVTKRLVLSLISRLFHPLGFITPFTMVAKCLFQELWRLGVSWDEVVPVNVQERFTQWVKSLELLRTWRIPRSYTGSPGGTLLYSSYRYLEMHRSLRMVIVCTYMCSFRMERGSQRW